eukprot:1189774-Prorocentrum_minimum.AAC.2
MTPQPGVPPEKCGAPEMCDRNKGCGYDIEPVADPDRWAANVLSLDVHSALAGTPARLLVLGALAGAHGLARYQGVAVALLVSERHEPGDVRDVHAADGVDVDARLGEGVALEPGVIEVPDLVVMERVLQESAMARERLSERQCTAILESAYSCWNSLMSK